MNTATALLFPTVCGSQVQRGRVVESSSGWDREGQQVRLVAPAEVRHGEPGLHQDAGGEVALLADLTVRDVTTPFGPGSARKKRADTALGNARPAVGDHLAAGANPAFNRSA